MESKYYTPDISEFHVGFEYEVFDSKYEYKVEKLSETKLKVLSDPITTTGWFKEAYEIDSFLYVEDSSDIKSNIPSYIENDKVRVKYLDREDIESLGFKEDQEYQSTVDESNSDWHYDYGMESNNKKLKLIYTNWRTYAYSEIDGVDYSKYNEYSVVKIIKSVIAGEQFTAFVGFIKNKSELKRVLKMIGYDYSN